MRGAVGRSCQLRAGIRVVVGTAIATVTSGLVLLRPIHFSPLPDKAFPSRPMDKLRFAEDEGYIRIS